MISRRSFLNAAAAGAASLAAGSALASTRTSSLNLPPLLPQSATNAAGRWQPAFRFGLGGAPIGGSVGIPVSDADALTITENAWNAGTRFFDTSPWYGLGLSERRFGMALHRKPRDEYILSTKVGRILKAAPEAPETAWA